MRTDDLIVKNPAVLARLPPGPSRTIVQWRGYWFTDLKLALFGKLYPTRPRAEQIRLVLRPIKTRLANAQSYMVGPLDITRPAPWLLGPALQLHPEAFEVRR